MKNYLIILSLLMVQGAFGYNVVHYEHYPNYGYYPYRSTFSKINTPTGLIRNIRFFNKNNGSLTGYSLPINKHDVYKQMGISPYDPKAKQKYGSINCAQELFSSPGASETYYRNGRRIRDIGGISTKTGVTIIYD